MSLMLLPPPPTSHSYATLNAAYGPPLKAALHAAQVQSANVPQSAILDVFVPCGGLGFQRQPRSASYARIQSLLSGLYKLVCVLGAQDGINLEDDDGVNVRIIPFNYPARASVSGVHQVNEDFEGPFVSIECVALSGSSWTKLFAVESEEGLRVCREFLSVQDMAVEVQYVKGGIVQREAESARASELDPSPRPHYSVAVGGTFDHLHVGHKLLLAMTLLVAEPPNFSREKHERTVTVGITGDELLKNKKYAEHLQSWAVRQSAISDFVLAMLDFCPKNHRLRDDFVSIHQQSSREPNGHITSLRFASSLTINCVEIQDPFGPTITDPGISALIISAETRGGAQAINSKRVEKDWAGLEVFEVDVLDAKDVQSGDLQGRIANDFETKISSTEIRRLQAEKAAKTTASHT
jgi:phosphopantetheine adenylyltransferase